MGITLCLRHGDSGTARVCSHIDSAVEAFSPVTDFEVWECYIFTSFSEPSCTRPTPAA